MKYDDASWHSGGDFPPESPEDYGGTHIGLFLRYCFTKGWAGEFHTEESADDVAKVIAGEMSGTDFLFEFCDGKFTTEDLNDDGNNFASRYYADNGHYLGDYMANFGDFMYTAPEADHDFAKFAKMADERLESGNLSG